MKGLAIELKGVDKAYPHFTLSNITLSLCVWGDHGVYRTQRRRKIHHDQNPYGTHPSGPCGRSARIQGRQMPDEQIAAKWDVGFVSEDMRLYKSATLDWHMGFVASIYPSWDAHYAQKLLRRFDLRREQKLQRFSHGERVKATLLLLSPAARNCFCSTAYRRP